MGGMIKDVGIRGSDKSVLRRELKKLKAKDQPQTLSLDQEIAKIYEMLHRMKDDIDSIKERYLKHSVSTESTVTQTFNSITNGVPLLNISQSSLPRLSVVRSSFSSAPSKCKFRHGNY